MYHSVNRKGELIRLFFPSHPLPSPRLVIFLLLLLAAGPGQLNILLGHARTVDKWKSKYTASPEGYFSSRSPPRKHNEDNDFSPIYGVSKRLVPRGPNPLHNRSIRLSQKERWKKLKYHCSTRKGYVHEYFVRNSSSQILLNWPNM